MKCLSAAKVDSIIQLLKSGHSGHYISSSLGVSVGFISKIRRKHCPDITKSSGGHPSKISPSNLHHIMHLMERGKIENVTQVLKNILNQLLASKTVRRHLKKAGMKAVVKKKKPLLSARHRKTRRKFAKAHLEWTVEDWKCVVWSDETKINHLGSDGRRWVDKKAREPLNDRLVEGTLKFGGDSMMVWGCMLWEGP